MLPPTRAVDVMVSSETNRVLSLKGNLKALRHLIEEENAPRGKFREKRQAVAYLMGDAKGLGFGSLMWYQRRLV